MANALGIDVGEIYRTVEAVKASRANRDLEERRLNNTLATQEAIKATVASGGIDNPQAMAQLVALNPEAAKTLTDTYTAMDERARKAERDRIEQIGAVAGGILQAKDPAAAYDAVRRSSPELAKLMPEQYDEDFVKVQLARAAEADKLFDSIDGDRTAERDQANKLALQHDAQAATASEGEKNRANQLAIKAQDQEFTINRDKQAFKDDLVKIEAKAAADRGGATVESKDASLIYRQSLELLGGVFDEAGNVQMLDPQLRSKGQEIAVRATKFFGEGLSHAEAVKRAAQELGISFPGSASADPKNTGNALTGDFLNILGQ